MLSFKNLQQISDFKIWGLEGLFQILNFDISKKILKIRFINLKYVLDFESQKSKIWKSQLPPPIPPKFFNLKSVLDFENSKSRIWKSEILKFKSEAGDSY